MPYICIHKESAHRCAANTLHRTFTPATCSLSLQYSGPAMHTHSCLEHATATAVTCHTTQPSPLHKQLTAVTTAPCCCATHTKHQHLGSIKVLRPRQQEQQQQELAQPWVCLARQLGPQLLAEVSREGERQGPQQEWAQLPPVAWGRLWGWSKAPPLLHPTLPRKLHHRWQPG